MAVSRRFGSRFMVSFSRYYVDIATLRVISSLASATTAEAAAPAIGVPAAGYAFQARYSAGWGVQAFVGSNYLSADNSLGGFPSAAVAWDHADWGRVPHRVSWYDDNNTLRLYGAVTGRHGPATYTIGSRTVRYRMYLSFWHQVEVSNNSEYPVTIWYRGFASHTFLTDGDFNELVMTSWASQEIAAGGSFLVTGYEPLEIKLDGDSTDRDLLGITDQTGNRTLLLF